MLFPCSIKIEQIISGSEGGILSLFFRIKIGNARHGKGK